MTNDDLSELERDIAAGRDIGNSRAKLLLEQLRSNAAEAVRVHKRLADAERELELLAKVRANPHTRTQVDRLKWEAKSWRDDATMFATVRSPDEFEYASCRADLNEELAALLSPGDANGGGNG